MMKHKISLIQIVCIILKTNLRYKKKNNFAVTDNVDKTMKLPCRIGKMKSGRYWNLTSSCYCRCSLVRSSVFLPSPTSSFVGLLSDSVQKIPRWNFWKFLVNPEGKVVRFWRTDEPVDSIREEVTALVREIILKKRVEL